MTNSYTMKDGTEVPVNVKHPIMDVVTPKGIATGYIHLQIPDDGYNGSNKDNPRYKCDLLISPKDAKEMMAEITGFRDAFVAHHKIPAHKLKPLPWGPDMDKKTGNLRSEDLVFKTWMKSLAGKNASVSEYHSQMEKQKHNPSYKPMVWPIRPMLKDANLNPYTGDEKIGPGSELIMALDCYIWNTPQGCGVNLRPKIVQIVKFVEATSNKREGVITSKGLKKITGGFVSAVTEENISASMAATDGDF